MKPVAYKTKLGFITSNEKYGDTPLYAIPEGYKLVKASPVEHTPFELYKGIADVTEEFSDVDIKTFNLAFKICMSFHVKMIEAAPEIEDL